MRKLDQREIGTVRGNPIYIDLSNVIDHKEKDELLSSRDLEYLIVQKIMSDFFTDTVEPKSPQEAGEAAEGSAA